MRFGLVFPQQEIGTDPRDLATYARRVEQAGFSYLNSYDHVLGADPSTRPGWSGPYDIDDHFHEPFVLYGYLAAITGLELVTGVVILPQRQTVLVAKQAAEVAVLSEGRLRLGVGVGWNSVEYEGLGKNFHDRGRRVEEQVMLLRRLFAERSVTFDGRYEKVHDAGISPRPALPVPIWMGGGLEPRVMERIGRMSDGWICNSAPGVELEQAIDTLYAAVRESGRKRSDVGLQGLCRIGVAPEPGVIADAVATWTSYGATHLSFDVGRRGRPVSEHLALVDELAEMVARAA